MEAPTTRSALPRTTETARHAWGAPMAQVDENGLGNRAWKASGWSTTLHSQAPVALSSAFGSEYLHSLH